MVETMNSRSHICYGALTVTISGHVIATEAVMVLTEEVATTVVIQVTDMLFDNDANAFQLVHLMGK